MPMTSIKLPLKKISKFIASDIVLNCEAVVVQCGTLPINSVKISFQKFQIHGLNIQ
jgi:hypothetical protein